MQRAHGFSLIEGLIAIVIFSLGLLGLASVLLLSQRLSQTSKAQTLAYTLAQDMSQRIASNPLGATSNIFIGGSANCTNASCNSYSELAAQDIADWQQLVQSQLPGATAVICRDSTPNDGSPNNAACDANADPTVPYTIKVWWQAPNSSGAERYTQTFTVSS